jgi:uncharacterized protein involved in exopolysaccharide biosynthesis
VSERESEKSIVWDFFELCYAWRKFIVVVVGIFTVLGVILAFVLPKEYEGVASVLPSQKSAMLSMLGGSAGSAVSSLAKQFAPLVGGSETQIGSGFSYLAILNSRDAMEKVVKKFDLKRVYSIGDSSMDKTIKELRDNTDFEIDKYGAVVVKVLDENPARAADMANYFIQILNEINGGLSSEDARNLRMVIEARYEKNLADLGNAEDSMKVFQQRYGLVSLPDQAKASVMAGAELESQLIISEVKLSALQKQLSAESPEIVTLNQQIEAMKQKIADFRTGKGMASGDNSGVFLPFKEMPSRAMSYVDLYREVEIQSKLLELIYPLYEQAKLEEARETPTVLVLDHAVPPEKKVRPLRSLIVLSSFVFGLVSSIIFIFFVINGVRKRPQSGTLEQRYYELSVKLLKKTNSDVASKLDLGS